MMVKSLLGRRAKKVFAKVCFHMQFVAKSSLLPNNGYQIISMQKCAVGEEAAASM